MKDWNDMVLKQLEDGLIIRGGRKRDAGRMQAFFARILREPDEPRGPENPVGIWTRDLFTRPHPTSGPGNFTIVEDTRADRIVSALGLIPQTWAYDGVEFGVGQVELVATEPGYRGRGLIREQMEIVHRWSSRRGHLMQVIEGIPYFYRQFGYEMCLPLFGLRAGTAANLPKPGRTRRREKVRSRYRLRPAAEADVSFLREVHVRACSRSLVSAVWDDTAWRYQLSGRSPGSATALEWRIIEDADGSPQGYLAHLPRFYESGFTVLHLEVAEGVSWLGVMPSVLEYVREAGERCGAEAGGTFDLFRFVLGTEHPAYRAASAAMPVSRPPYAWYVRVANLRAFLRRIAPALERRLAASEAAGYSGQLKLSFYRDGLRLFFEEGRIVRIGSWARPGNGAAGARFPDQSFLHLLFGRRSLDELLDWYADCTVSGDEARLLVGAIFPKRPSHPYAIG